MSSLRRLSPFVTLALLAAGCSDGNFAVANPAEDVGTDAAETAVLEDSSNPPEDVLAVDSTESDGGAPDAAPIDSTSVDDASVDSVALDAADTAVADTAVADTCVLNACGGCSVLTGGKPGDACGECGTLTCSADKSTVTCKDPGKNPCGGCAVLAGKVGDACGGATCGSGTLQCKNSEAFECKGAATNACGGCGALDHPLESACGLCGSGKYICDSSDPTKTKTLCKDVVSTPAPGVGCGGKCGSATYVCSADKLSTTCVDPVTTSAPGASCGGKCGTAKFACSTDKLTTTCVDPVTTPAVGTACGGKCGSAKYACAGDGLSTACVDPVTTSAPGTSCGGKCSSATFVCSTDKLSTSCVDPVTTAAPGTACGGKCGSATFVCSTDKKSTACVDPVPSSSPAPASVCGVCGTSTNLCNTAKTDVVCQKPEDRSVVVGPNQTAATTTGYFNIDRITLHAISPLLTAAKATRITSVSLLLDRDNYVCEVSSSDCSVPDPECSCVCATGVCVKSSSLPDSLKVELVAGTLASPGAVLDTATISPTAPPVWTPAVIPTTAVTFNFSKDHLLPAGAPYFFRVAVTGGSYTYRIYGKPLVSGSPHRDSYFQSGGWSHNGVEPYLVVAGMACP